MNRHISDQGLVSIYQTCREIELDQAAPAWQKEAAALVRMLLGTGCRIGELTGPRGVLIQDCRPPMFRIREGKTKASSRTIKVFPEAQAWFEKIVALRRLQGASRLFPVCIRTGQRHFDYIMERSGVDTAGSHTARRTFISDEIITGRLNVLTCQAQVGHKRLKTTSEHYFKALPEWAWEPNKEPEWRKEAMK